jgi:PAS domain S-box-containing protein
MGLPIMRGERMVAMAGVANRPGGYTQDMIELLRPYLTAVASLIEAHNSALERKAIQTNLRHSEDRFRRILESASEGILLVNMDGDILLANQQASEIFGYDRETLVSQSALDLLPLSRDDLAVNGDAYGQPGFVRQIGNHLDLHAHRQDGTRFPIRINLSYIEDNGDVQALCLIEDVTFRKQLEEQRLYTKTLQIELEKERELMELKQRFISMISHEFRTPLTVMLSSSQILERYHDRLSHDRFLKHVKSFKPQIEKMTGMLEEVLLVNKADANLLEFNPKPTDIRQMLEEFTDKARLIDDYQHDIDLYCEDTIPQILKADPALLEHILMNLLTNATKYSPTDKSITLDVQHDTDSDELVIHVKDEGIGIPEDDQKRLFQPFHRAKNVQNIKGTGLGLTIVKNSAELHGGSVTFVSYPGEGSIFTIRLPLVVAESDIYADDEEEDDDEGDITQTSHSVSTG